MHGKPGSRPTWLHSLHLVPVPISHVAMYAGENMVYAERWGKGLLPAIASSMITNAVVLLLVAAAKVSVIRKWFPKPGNGPAREVLEGGCFICSCYALSEETDDSEPWRVKSFIKVCPTCTPAFAIIWNCAMTPIHLLQHKMSPSRSSSESISDQRSQPALRYAPTAACNYLKR